MDHHEKHDIPSLEGRIRNLSKQLKHVADDTDLEEMFVFLHRPGWTTPAEYLLVSGIVDVMHEHAKAMVSLKQVLINGSRAVNVELNPQPLPPKAE